MPVTRSKKTHKKIVLILMCWRVFSTLVFIRHVFSVLVVVVVVVLAVVVVLVVIVVVVNVVVEVIVQLQRLC